MSKSIDLTGQKFGRLKAIEYAEKNNWGRSLWLCECDCGNKTIVRGSDLKNGHTKSCGCLQKEIVTKHGHWSDKIYIVWVDMIQRCTNSNHKYWKDYGGRGITVCDEWLHSFPNFKRDNPGWKPGLTLERRKNELGYFKDNCEWVTQKENNRNKRNNLYVPYNGENRLFVELCEEHNMPYNVVHKRFYKLGWTLERALTEPVKKRRK